MTTLERRFVTRVKQGTNGCWLWEGATRTNGYGTFALKRQGRWTQTTAHRIAFELYVGQIPDGYEVDHLCRVRGCVRPDHLEAVTVQENRRRRDAKQTLCYPTGVRPIPQLPEKAAPAKRNPHLCKNGHDRRQVGTVPNGKGRTCAACRAEQQARKRTGNAHGTETHCPSGHPYAGDNIYFRHRPNGAVQRECRTCVRARNRAAYYRRRSLP
jgi:hypothetical protein